MARKRKVLTFKTPTLTGSTGVKTLVGENGQAKKLPAGAKVVGCYLEGGTTLTSGGAATVALGITGNADAFKAVTAFDNAAFAGTAFTKAENEVPLEVGSASSVIATVADAALTAGAFKMHVEVLV